jgi:hypothetical protein
MHSCQRLEVEDPDSETLAVKRAGDHAAPTLIWLESATET